MSRVARSYSGDDEINSLPVETKLIDPPNCLGVLETAGLQMTPHMSLTEGRSDSGLLSKMFPMRFPLAEFAPIPLRLIVGYGFLAHGLAKLGRGPDHFAGILDAMGVPLPYLASLATIVVEVGGGIAVLLGAFVMLVSIPMTIVLLVAMFTVHWPYGFSSIKLMSVTEAGAHFGQPGYECDLLYLACIAALVLAGPGPLALDNAISRRLRAKA